MLVTVDGRGNLDKQCDVNVREWDKDLMVLGLFSGRGQRGHRLSNSTGTDRATVKCKDLCASTTLFLLHHIMTLFTYCIMQLVGSFLYSI